MSAPDPVLPMDIVREVGIVLARRALDNPWIDHLWSPHGVLFPVPDCAAGELLSEEGDVRLVFAGAATVQLYVPETANYRDNLSTGTPLLWIAARTNEGGTPVFLRVTADPTEGEAQASATFVRSRGGAPEQLTSRTRPTFVEMGHLAETLRARRPPSRPSSPQPLSTRSSSRAASGLQLGGRSR